MTSTAGFVARGAERLARTTKAAARQLVELRGAQQAAGALLTPLGRSAAPRVSGALGRSIQARHGATGLEVGSDLDYAGVVHWGWPRKHIRAQPFLADRVRQAQPAVVRTYDAGLEKVLRTIKGA